MQVCSAESASLLLEKSVECVCLFSTARTMVIPCLLGSLIQLRSISGSTVALNNNISLLSRMLVHCAPGRAERERCEMCACIQPRAHHTRKNTPHGRSEKIKFVKNNRHAETKERHWKQDKHDTVEWLKHFLRMCATACFALWILKYDV